MIKIEIPGDEELRLENLVLDVNGTLAIDGQLLPGIADLLLVIREKLTIHLLTADTHGKQDEIDQTLGLTAIRVRSGKEGIQKAAYVKELGSERTAAIGQGANDALMLTEARIGICVLSKEGTAVNTLVSADLVVPDTETALSLFLHPTRLIASLRK